MARLLVLIATVLLAGGCQLLPSDASGDYDIVVNNGTTLDVAIIVNGSIARVVNGGASASMPATTLGALPWAIEAKTSSGRVLASMEVSAGSTGCTQDPAGGGTSCRGVVRQVDLSCGRFEMYTNGSGFSGGPAPGPGTPGDCQP